MRRTVAFSCLVAGTIIAAPSWAAECAGNPDAIGTSRTIVVDPAEHNRLGGYQYTESLPLNDKEVVLTFDDGPLPPHSNRILDVLARECVKATFFMVGRMARTFPRVVRRIYEDGHNLASHSQNHPFNFYSMSLIDAAREIEDSFDAITAAVGDPAKVSPFFRFPGLHRQDAVERYLASKGRMTWSVDFMADDWTRIGSHEIVRRALARIESKGKGILMLHDIKPTTAAGLQLLLDELKVRGYRIVHAVPATADRPRTVTTAEQWLVPNPPTPEQLANREPSIWPRAAPPRVRAPETALDTPSILSFGAGASIAAVPIDLVAVPQPLHNDPHEIVAPASWPTRITVTAPPGTELLPIPAANNFLFTTMTRRRSKAERDQNRPGRSASSSAASPDVTGSVSSGRPSESKASRSSKSNGTREARRSRDTGRSKDARRSRDTRRSDSKRSGHQI